VSRCKACGEAFRKGKRTVVINFDGSLSVEVVCRECVSRSVRIVTRFPRAQMTVNGLELLQRVSDRLRTMLTAASSVSVDGERQTEYTQGRISALSSAVELMQRAISGVAP
jgi:hypothetical protein